MNIRFDLQLGKIIVDLYPSSIPIGDPEGFDHGKYVRMVVATGDGGVGGKPETDKRVRTHLVMSKSEARAIASAIMGVAAAL
jgi:hypothetical protein